MFKPFHATGLWGIKQGTEKKRETSGKKLVNGESRPIVGIPFLYKRGQAWAFEIFPKKRAPDLFHKKEGVGKIGVVVLKK